MGLQVRHRKRGKGAVGFNAATFTYDAFNRLKTATKGGQTTSYQVNGLGQRKSKFINGAFASAYLPDPSGQVMLEAEPAHNNWRWMFRLNGRKRPPTSPVHSMA